MTFERSDVEIVRGCGVSVKALTAALTSSEKPLVYVIDGDIPALEGRLDDFLARLNETKADIVIGTKRSRLFLNRLYFFFVRLFLALPISDTQTGARLYRREVLDYALKRALAKSAAFDLELLTIAATRGAKIAEVEVMPPAGFEQGQHIDKGVFRAIATDTLAIFYRARVLGYYERCLVPKPLDHEVFVSVVIACPKGGWMLRECLNALKEQTYQAFEVIVLPDAEDPSIAEDGAGLERLRVLPTGRVRPAEKRNIGIARAAGEVVAFIDDDAFPRRDWLEQAVRYFGEESIGAVGGPGVTPAGDSFLSRLGGRVYENALVSGSYRYRYRAGGVRRDVEDFPSCNLFVRATLLSRLGGYRTDFWPGEDTLLCKDILDDFKRIVYDPWVIVSHHRRPLFLPHLRQLGRYGFHRGYFCKRFPSNSLRLCYFVPTFFVLYLLAWPLVFLCLHPSESSVVWLNIWGTFLFLPTALYATLLLATTFSLNPLAWLVTALGVFLSHITYGFRFLQGLLSRQAPCEFIGRDHGSALKGKERT